MATRSVNSSVAAGFGAVYTLVGLAGFFVSETIPATDSASRSTTCTTSSTC